MTQVRFKQWLDQTYAHIASDGTSLTPCRSDKAYDFLCLEVDLIAKVGHAFVNFIRPMDIIIFSQARVGTTWECTNVDMVCDVAYAHIQGRPALIENFQNSYLLDGQELSRPLKYCAEDWTCGRPEANPSTVKTLHRARSSRSSQAMEFAPPGSLTDTRTICMKHRRSMPLQRTRSSQGITSFSEASPRGVTIPNYSTNFTREQEAP